MRTTDILTTLMGVLWAKGYVIRCQEDGALFLAHKRYSDGDCWDTLWVDWRVSSSGQGKARASISVDCAHSCKTREFGWQDKAAWLALGKEYGQEAMCWWAAWGDGMAGRVLSKTQICEDLALIALTVEAFWPSDTDGEEQLRAEDERILAERAVKLTRGGCHGQG